MWQGSSIDTRKDLKISTCGFEDGVDADPEVELSVLESPDSGGSRSSVFGVGTVLVRIGREESGAGVERGSRLRSEMELVSEAHVLVDVQPGVTV